jgi:hypothetical protein
MSLPNEGVDVWAKAAADNKAEAMMPPIRT